MPLVFLTMHRDEHYLHAALDLGVKGYVLKDSAITEIVGCLKAVVAGQDYVSPALSSYLIRRSTRAAALAAAKPALDHLTPTERRVLKLIAEGQTSREIAAELGIGIRTVEHHRNNIARSSTCTAVTRWSSSRSSIRQSCDGRSLKTQTFGPTSTTSAELPIRIRRTTDRFFVEPSIHAARRSRAHSRRHARPVNGL